MAHIARDSQMSKSPLYRRYDDAIDVAVDVWDFHLRDHLHHIIDEIRNYVGTGDEQSLNWLCAEMCQPSPESTALIECIAVARRYEYLFETVELDVDRVVEDYLSTLSHLPTDIALAYVVYVFGGLFVGSLLPCNQSEIKQAFEMWADYLNDESLRIDAEMPKEICPIPLRMPDTDDPTISHLIVAATRVITRTGFEKATANRIARYANKAFSTSYAYFDSKEELMTYATEFVFRDSIVRNDMMFFDGDINQQTSFSASRIYELSNPSASEETRLFRIEATLAARHHESLGLSVSELFEQSLNQVLAVTGKNKKLQDEVKSVWISVRISGFGYNVFGLVAPNYRDVNWMSTARAAALVVRNHAISHYVVDVSEATAS
jgi:DNA-binding transcriptional regulator YbjK